MGLFDLVWIAVIGLVVGLIARFLMPGKDPMGLLMTMVLGIAGSFVGTFLGRLLFGGRYYSAGFIMSVIGAVILLWLYRMISKRS
ncbi:MAG: GlsB/YeaQ/YmgE family stress response membrane protein [Blastocatellales bacterium]